MAAAPVRLRRGRRPRQRRGSRGTLPTLTAIVPVNVGRVLRRRPNPAPDGLTGSEGADPDPGRGYGVGVRVVVAGRPGGGGGVGLVLGAWVTTPGCGGRGRANPPVSPLFFRPATH